MSQIQLGSAYKEGLPGRVFVLAGGANGIGAATVKLLHEHGAYVVFGDRDEKQGEALVQGLPSTSKGQVHFLQTNVTDYQSLFALFQLALNLYGRVDSAISLAGIMENGNWFDSALTVETVSEVPNKAVLEVNLLGTLYFSRLASVFLRHQLKADENKSIVLMSSVAGFKESPGLFLYGSTKHGIMGLMRSLRRYLPQHGIRVNAICPWMTATSMVASIEPGWRAAGLPMNEPVDVAELILGLDFDRNLNGKGVFVEGGRGWEMEENLDRLEPQWLGAEPSAKLKQAHLGKGLSSQHR